MEVHQLRSFLCVVHLGSASRAAASMSLTQPAVTQHIRALESDLGVMLFERTGRGLTLTAAGEVLRQHALRGLSAFDDARTAVRSVHQGSAGTLSIAAGVTTSIFQLPSLLRAFRGSYPGVDITIHMRGSVAAAEMVRAREVDFAFVTSAVSGKDLRRIELLREQIVLVAAPTSADRQSVSLSELRELPLILFPHPSGFRQYIDRAVLDRARLLRVKMELDSVEAIKSFVTVGLGASFLPRSAVAAELAAGTLKELHCNGLRPLERSTSLVYRRGQYLAAPQQAFLQQASTHWPKAPAA